MAIKCSKKKKKEKKKGAKTGAIFCCSLSSSLLHVRLKPDKFFSKKQDSRRFQCQAWRCADNFPHSDHPLELLDLLCTTLTGVEYLLLLKFLLNKAERL